MNTALSFNDVVSVDDLLVQENLPRMILVTPLNGAVNVSPATPIVLDLYPGLGHIALPYTVTITVDGILAWTESGARNSWTGVAAPTTQTDVVRYRLYPPQGFAYGAKIEIETTFRYDPMIDIGKADTVTVSETWSVCVTSNNPGYLAVYGVLVGAPVYSPVDSTVCQTSGDQ